MPKTGIARATCRPEHSNRPRISSRGECNSCYSRRHFLENPQLIEEVRKRRDHERYLERKDGKKLAEPIVCRECGNDFIRRVWKQKTCDDCLNGGKVGNVVNEEPEFMRVIKGVELPPFRPLPKKTKEPSGLKWAHKKFDPEVVRAMQWDVRFGWFWDV